MIRRNTAILFGIFILLLAGTLVWRNWKASPEGAEATPTSSTDLLLNLEEAAIKAISVQDASGRRVSMARNEENEWMLVYPRAEETDQSLVTSAISQLLNARITARPQEIPELATLGLDPAAITILIETQDGEQVLINAGNLTPTEGGYYVLTEERVIYVVSKFGIDGLVGLLDNPPIQVTATSLPTPISEPALSTSTQVTPEEATATP